MNGFKHLSYFAFDISLSDELVRIPSLIGGPQSLERGDTLSGFLERPGSSGARGGGRRDPLREDGRGCGPSIADEPQSHTGLGVNELFLCQRSLVRSHGSHWEKSWQQTYTVYINVFMNKGTLVYNPIHVCFYLFIQTTNETLLKTL